MSSLGTIRLRLRAITVAALIAAACGGNEPRQPDEPTALTIENGPSDPIAPGTMLQLKATGTFARSATRDLTSTAAWSSSATAVARVSNAGLLTAVAKGMATIKAASGEKEASITVMVSEGPNPMVTLTSLTVSPSAGSLMVGATVQLTATGRYSDGTDKNVSSMVTWTSSSTGVATVSGAGEVRGVMAGMSTIKAALGGKEATSTITCVAPPPATLSAISVSPATAMLAPTETAQIAATGSYSDGTEKDLTSVVTWSSSAASVATVSGGGKITAVAAGSASISAKFMNKEAAVAVTVRPANVSLTSLTITPAAPEIAVAGEVKLKAEGTFSDGSKSDVSAMAAWTSSMATIATVGSSGDVKGVAVGMTVIKAALSGKEATVTVKVKAAELVELAISPAEATLAAGTVKELTVEAKYADGTKQTVTGTATWSSSNAAIATVSDTGNTKGRVTAVAAGMATITAKLGAKTATATLTVTAAVLESLTITPANPKLAKETRLPLVATGKYTDGSTQDLTTSVAWTSETTAVATVATAPGSQGVVTGVAAGTSKVKAAVAGKEAVVDLTVTNATLDALAVSPTDKTITVGTKQAFKVTGTFSDQSTQDLGGLVTWTSSNQAVAEIDGAGVATGKAVGSTQIKATWKNVTFQTTLTVQAAVLQSVSVTPATAKIADETIVQLTAMATYNNGSTVDVTQEATWESLQATIATVANGNGLDGQVKAKSPGAATIKATFHDKSDTAAITVTAATISSIAVTPAAPSIVDGTTTQFKATGTFSDQTTQDVTALVSWTATNPAVATVSDVLATKGKATAVAAGTTTITAAWNGKSGSTTLTVTPATLESIAITPASPSIAKGTRLALTATGTYSDGTTQVITNDVIWDVTSGSAASVNDAGIVTASAMTTGTIAVRAKMGAVSKTMNLMVTGATLTSVALAPTSATVAVNASLPFKLVGTFSDNSTQDLSLQAAWTSQNTAVATVNRGAVRGEAAGATTVTGSVTIAGVQKSATATVTVTN